MAGDIKRQRKSWTLQDRSKVSINILRANLAEEGDENAQLDVAKRLLQESADCGTPEKNRKENARLALYWLIKSSEQGNDEATQLLNQCLKSGSGLTAQNILDVRTCVTTPKYEKLTFKAARLLHRKLSNGEEFITTAQLLARMNAKGKSALAFEGCYSNGAVIQEEIFAQEENARDLLEEQQNVQTEKEENSINTTDVTAPPQVKDAFSMKDVDLNETYIVSSHAGARPPVSSSLAHSTSTKQKINRSPRNQSQMGSEESVPQQLDLQFAMIQSGKKLTLSDLLNVAKDFNVGRTPKISVDERNKILLRHNWNVDSFRNVFILQFLTLAVLGNVIHAANAVMYAIFLGIVWSCYNCFLWKIRCRNFKDWKLAFETVLAEKWDTDKLKLRLSKHYMIPHLIIFSLGPLFIHLLTDNVDQISLLFISVGIPVIISIQFGLRQKLVPTWQHLLVLTSTLLYYQPPSITKLLGESVQEQTSLLHQPMFQIGDSDQLKYLSLSIDVFTLLTCAILCTTVKLSLHNILTETIPDVVSTLWLIKVVHTSVTVECSDFLFGICIGLALCGVMVLFCSCLQSWKVFFVIISGIMILVTSILIVASSHKEFSKRSQVEGLEDSSEEVRFLEWEDYEASCHRKAWSVQSPAATQIKCSTMYGSRHDTNNMLVKWKGRISIVKVEKISRSLLDTNSLENVVFDISVGIFPSHKDDESRNWQNFLSGSSDTENVAPASLIVTTSSLRNKKQKQDLIDHVLNLRSGDRIEFIGKLKGSTAGSLKPQIIDVQSIQCLSCTTADYGEFVIEQNNGEEMHALSWFRRWMLRLSMQVKSSSSSVDLLEKSRNYIASLFSSVYRVIINGS